MCEEHDYLHVSNIMGAVVPIGYACVGRPGTSVVSHNKHRTKTQKYLCTNVQIYGQNTYRIFGLIVPNTSVNYWREEHFALPPNQSSEPNWKRIRWRQMNPNRKDWPFATVTPRTYTEWASELLIQHSLTKLPLANITRRTFRPTLHSLYYTKSTWSSLILFSVPHFIEQKKITSIVMIVKYGAQVARNSSATVASILMLLMTVGDVALPPPDVVLWLPALTGLAARLRFHR